MKNKKKYIVVLPNGDTTILLIEEKDLSKEHDIIFKNSGSTPPIYIGSPADEKIKEAGKALSKALLKATSAMQECCKVLDSFSQVKEYGVPKMRNIPPTPKKKK